jgi:phenylacetic acid degradation operon negative regulatory protein
MSRKSPTRPAPADSLSARELILALMDSTAARTLSASYLIAAGRLFDMDPGSVRVALARLVRDGSLENEERGTYGLGSRAGTLHTLVRNWSRAETAVRAWRGGWLAVLVAHLSRRDKTRVRGTERALSLFGFAEAQAGFWIRPDNLSHELDAARHALIQLGLDEQAVALRISELAPSQAIDPTRLWDREGLERRYRRNLERLGQSRERLAELDDAEAARETLLIGRQITRDILLDPLLPEELVDAALRGRMMAAMRDYDRLGRDYWREFYRRHERDQKPAA